MKTRQWLIDIRGIRTQEDIAELCGISRSAYSNYELGNRDPRFPVAKKIAKALGFDWQLFFDPNCPVSKQKRIKKTA